MNICGDKNLVESVLRNLNNFITELGHSVVLVCSESKPFVAITSNISLDYFQQSSCEGLLVFANRPFIGEGIVRDVLDFGIPPNNVCIVGIGEQSELDIQDAYRLKLAVFPMHEVVAEGIQSVCDAITAKVRLIPKCYVVCDMGVLSQPAGLSGRELLYLFHRLSLLKNICAAELTGVSDNEFALVYKILKELCSLPKKELLLSNEKFK